MEGGTAPRGRGRGRCSGSYLHGPLLARNTELADLLVGWALSDSPAPVELDPLDDTDEAALRQERLAAVGAADRRRRWWGPRKAPR